MDVVTGGVVGGATKIAMARQAAIEAAALLQPGDTLGVVAFDSAFQWVVEPTKLGGSDDIRRAQGLISTIRPGGGTSIFAPLQAAYEAVAQIDAPLRHVVLLTDGESSDRGYEALIERMRPANITLSTLAVGSDSDTRLLSSLARLGGGRYYFTERSAQIPRIASKETTILTRNAVIDGRVAAAVGEPSPLLRSLSGEFPALTGYIATTRKDRAVTALESERGHPLLAHWQYGLGRVVAWTSQAQTGWTSEWESWPEAGRYWSQVLRWALPAPVESDFQPVVQVAADGRHVSLGLRTLRARRGLFRSAGHAGNGACAGWLRSRSGPAAGGARHLRPGDACRSAGRVPRPVQAGPARGSRGLCGARRGRGALRRRQPRAAGPDRPRQRRSRVPRPRRSRHPRQRRRPRHPVLALAPRRRPACSSRWTFTSGAAR